MSLKLPILPLHYGHTGQPWPPGEYWLIEHVRQDAPRLYWMDATNGQDQTGWSYLPQQAAGFADKGAAIFAFKERGRTAVDGGQVEAFSHIWETGP